MARFSSSSESGFTLLELLLVIGVGAIVFLGISQITRSWVDSEISTGAGQHMQRISTIAQKYVEAKWVDGTGTLTETLDAVADGKASPAGPWGELYTTLKQEGLLNATDQIRSPLGVPLVITYKIDTSGAKEVYRVSVISDGNIPNKKALQAARDAGSTGGTVAVTPTSPSPASANTAIGAFGQWRVAIANLVPGGAAAFNSICTRTASRGCLVSMAGYSTDTLCGPFLYRNDMSSSVNCSDGNTMSTNLNMNNYDINNAANINTRDLSVNNTANLGTTNVGGVATFNGPTTASNGLTVNNGMTVTGDANFSDNVNMAGGGTLNVANLNASQVQAPKIVTNDLNTQDMNIQGAMTVNDNMSVNGNMVMTSPGSQMYTGEINAGNIYANGGDISVGEVNVQNVMTINGGVNITNSNITSDNMVVDKCVQLWNSGTGSYDKYGPGCP